ncbi:MAG TPA: sigma-70 family RNA polymerase sigma factor [Verrucomicrobiales bacterium]|nr:sigma-70 family RNA polymerase sigma factor [Verrucomicrobiales bacterium]
MPEHDRTEEFICLLARYERQVSTYVMVMVPHVADAEDIIQEAKLVMWRHFSKFKAGTSFLAWARKIAFHQVLAFRKRKQRDRLQFSEEFLTVIAEEAENASDYLEKRRRTLTDCIEKLQGQHREIIQLRYHQGLGVEAIADRVDRTEGALYRVLSRIRQMLHSCVSRQLMRS